MESICLTTDEIINDTLKQWNICSICRIRILYRNFNFESFENHHQSADLDLWTCYLCCGILQQRNSEISIIDQITVAVKDSGFNFDTFELNISTPPNLLIREHSVCHSLAKLYPNRSPAISSNDITTVKSIWKWSVKEKVAKSLEKVYLNGKEATETRLGNEKVVENDDLLSVGVCFSHGECDRECSILGDLDPALFQRRRRGEKRYNWEMYTRRTVLQLLQKTSGETLARYCRAPPNHVMDKTNEGVISVDVKLSRAESIIIGGRYCKYSRRLPQSPWIFDGVRKLEGSVEEYITESLLRVSLAESNVFVSSGREDVDVRMLGQGRPFMVELRNCKAMGREVRARLGDLEREINGGSEGKLLINRLSVVSKESVSLIKKGEEEKSKQYRAVVYCEKGLLEDGRELEVINGTKDLKTMQWTPIRVLHRRSLIERPRTFYSLFAAPLESVLTEEAIGKDNSLADYSRFLDTYDKNHLFVLHLRCQAGSYIKEFVHGDLGRTKPNLGSLIGQGCDILALDVMEIELEWPPITASCP